uniref:Uncharacterized protein n=1 Tax=Arundo donax TaxID=35708 RepID=A0A0A8XWT7_ARUDO
MKKRYIVNLVHEKNTKNHHIPLNLGANLDILEVTQK